MSVFQDIYKETVDENYASPCSLAYFEGDFWPNIFEDCLREEEEREREMANDGKGKVKEEEGLDVSLE